MQRVGLHDVSSSEAGDRDGGREVEQRLLFVVNLPKPLNGAPPLEFLSLLGDSQALLVNAWVAGVARIRGKLGGR